MGEIQAAPLWLKKNEAVSAGTYQSPWYNAEALDSFQLFLKYTGAVNTTLNLHLSPADARGVDGGSYGGVAPGSAYESVAVLTVGDNRTAGFCSPAAGGPQDYPFKSFRVELVVAAGGITACYLAVIQNILGGT